MPLDEVRTQVLLLHSEQSTLDSLSSGFSDRYTVHCATTGTEALNTLGDTPIHVIVSAQKLPGMSGVEALREAKKRSPETIGILLANNDDQSVEALVGEKEVFQVVSGGVSPADLGKLIDNATRQMRLLALAESANDTAANPDEPVSEHIVMETSENGSTIISDGTGTMPILDPQKVSAAAAAGSRAVDVLVLTKDDEFLDTVKESSRGMHNIRYANTLAQAEEALARHKVGVAVVDAAMVGPNVEKLTQHLRKKTSRLVNIVAGRRDDGEMLMDLINRGKVYRFLLKPVSPGRARLAVEASVKHHLEAPDSAFKITGDAAPPKPVPKPVPKAEPKRRPVAKAEPKPVPKAEPRPKPPKADPKPEPPKAAAKPTPVPSPKPADKPAAEPAAKPAADIKPVPEAKPEPARTATKRIEPTLSPIDSDNFAAFDDGPSFTETIAGVVEDTRGKVSGSQDGPGDDVPFEPSLDLDGDDGGIGSLVSNPKVLGIAAVAAVVLIGAGIWMFSGSDEPPAVAETASTQDSVTEADPVFDSMTDAETVTPSSDDLLEEARLARDAGQVFDPPGSNAIELYAAALRAAPDDADIATELDEVLQQALGMAESAMLERRADEAAAALQRVALADPDNARLPFLSAQLIQMQMRDNLDAARTAIRASRLEDAAIALDAATRLNSADTTELDAVAEELATARNEQALDGVLARAADRLEQGQLIAPANDNARYFYELALARDPGNTAAEQGLTVIASKLVMQARTEIDRGAFESAENLLADARRLDPTSSELAASTRALSDARESVTAEASQEAERRATAERAEADRIAAAERAEADRIAVAERAEAEQIAAAERAEADRIAAEQLAEKQRQAALDAANEPPVDSRVDETSSTGDVVADATEILTDDVAVDVAASTSGDEGVQIDDATAATTPPQAESARAERNNLVGISSLTRVKYVAPKYPRTAERRNLSGWVDIIFTVATDGSTQNIEIRDSNPGDVFVNAATRAVERWEFEPVIENGVAVEKRAGVRMMFALE